MKSLNQTTEQTLERLSADIATLTELIDQAERMGHYYLVTIFSRERTAVVAQAEILIGQLIASGEAAEDDRRFLLVCDPEHNVIASFFPQPRMRPSPKRLALTP